ncbi:MAG TPA: polyphosphate kinase 1 [Thermoanaerobaculia bacterium]|nr:polyphosphate kinase 1 [Thermoanaerobaculia bacterium]
MADLNVAGVAPEVAPVPAVTSAGTIKVPPIAVPAEPVRLFNREFSWIEFNRRVLAEALDPTVPLLERVKFLSIASGNLDEFLMVRVGAIRELLEAGVQDRSPDGLTPKQQLKGIRERVKAQLVEMYRCLETIVPELQKAGISIESFTELSKKEQAALTEHFEKYIAPILTPLAVDPGHPFPFLASRALTIAAALETDRGESHVALMKVPPLLSRFIQVPDGGARFVPVESLIEQHLSRFFPGLVIRRVIPFRVIRNVDSMLQEDEVQDLLKSVESELRRRERKEVVWIEVAAGADESMLSLLSTALRVTQDDVFFTTSLPKLSDLMELYRNVGKPSLKEPGFNPRIPPQLASSDDLFAIIRDGDVLLHRPYDSFTPIVEFVQTAAEDPEVLAIKQTLYRTDTGSAIIDALVKAAQRGKQVTAIVELQARFDESKNIAWARRLEEAGVQVVYGLVGIKTHSKICMVIRREGTELRRYVHLSTGNYNAVTARIYTDIDLFTVEPAFGDDASQFMNLLTGYSIATIQDIFDKQVPGWSWKQIVVAPMDYHEWALRMIDRETRAVKDGKPGHIIAKMNALVDPTVIEALYKASQAGVRIDLIVRGTCCLVPGVSGLSDNIKVTSIIDRFLEHSRILLFRSGGATEVYVASGDWMPRNFFRRIELCFPILSEKLRVRIEEQILKICLADNVKAWRLQPDGTYKKRSNNDPPLRSQEKFIETARAEAVRLGPYEETISKPAAFRKKAKRHRKRDKEKSKS